jgi:glutamate racemase
VDTVVLGCTHYPFVREAIAAALGPDVHLLDSGEAIARQTERVLRERGALAAGPGSLRVLTTGDPAEVARVVARVWGDPIPVEHVDVTPDPVQVST